MENDILEMLALLGSATCRVAEGRHADAVSLLNEGILRVEVAIDNAVTSERPADALRQVLRVLSESKKSILCHAKV